MKYNQPLDQPSNPTAPYINGNPAAGIQGSIVPGESIEYDQREIIEVITRANVRGYTDFSGSACLTPANSDLTQLRKAIEGFITNWQFIISTEVTFTVHGSGADFADLNDAFAYLGKYRITPTGHVILQLAGAAAGSAQAARYLYTRPIVVNHPNNDRISIFGAPMLAPVSRTDAGYAWNGNSAAQRSADTQTNLSIMRTKFATELQFSGRLFGGWFPVAGMQIIGSCLQHLDGILFTGDGVNDQGSGVLFMCAGSLNNLPRTMAPDSPWAYDGLAAINFRMGSGFNFDVGSCVSSWGQTPDQNFNTCFFAFGCANGIAITNGGFITAFGNAVCLGNDSSGFYLWPRSGTQWDGGLFCNANAGQGIQCYLSSTGYLNFPQVAGQGFTPSHCYRNAGYGLWAQQTNATCQIDFGAGGNANGAGSIWANGNTGIIVASSQNFVGTCTPAYNTVGNGNSMIH